MRAKVFFIVCVTAMGVRASETVLDSVALPDVEVSVSRTEAVVSREASAVTVADMRLVETARVVTPKDVAALAPNVHMPDYGSAMTSSIYIRGLGSRINEPVLCMVVDGVPLMDKNMFDHTMQDVKRIELLRGPQGSLYGRNSPGGVMEIRTIRPLDLAEPLARGLVSYGSANTIRAQASYYRAGWGVAVRYTRTDGFYTNIFDNSKADRGQTAGGRLVYDCRPSASWRVTASVTADWLKQGAFPYAGVATGTIDYNRPGGYERITLFPYVQVQYRRDGYRLNLTAGYQMLLDDMRMDQDYTRADIFTLRQTQRQHNGILDAILSGRFTNSGSLTYHWNIGVSTFVKSNGMQAPVTFMREGIETLILNHANNGIRTVFPDDSIAVSNTTLPVSCDFGLLNAGAAVTHRSRLQAGRWCVEASLRIDCEYARMDYLSTADIDYRFTLLMDNFERVHTELKGVRDACYVQVLPRLSVSYDTQHATLYAYAAKGYKAGGFNPQIFSTVTQNQVMTDLAADMGMHLNIADPRYSDVRITSYRPETDWTFEAGAHVTPVEGLKIDMDVFHIRCYDQQVTVFPGGKTTGRMMANAARSRVWGAEAALQYRWLSGNWSGLVHASYGFTDARFIAFNDGFGDYAGRFVPYAPQHTAHILASAGYRVGHKALEQISLAVRTDGAGRIWWNERNDASQPFYALMAATLTLGWQYVQLDLWARNLTGTEYDVFRFRSMNNDFVQKGRPRELGATIRWVI